ncbi:DUF6482 family protein [Vibrio sp. Isolate30]|jgi:uncharacterized protein YwlG (UPF0340 family)|uniref:DUF6482 family protein n=1 Tax=Vibrio fortis TaxID=212667 RepID=UPI001EFE4AAB|nr:DUF6482 family protein [Vibrio fortis]MCG9632498.1 DUF6482 family protein [Vibrio sp. Isolate30]
MNLLIESFEGGIYLAYQVTDHNRRLVMDSDQHPKKFMSLNQVRDHFHDHSITSATLVHNSAYDEMCGEQCGSDTPLSVDLRW